MLASECLMILLFYILMSVFRQKLSAALQIWSTLTPQSIFSRDTTQGTETARRHALESHAKNLQSVQAMEKSMDISSRWTPESAEWVAAAEKARMRRYQRCIDTLEGLVVSRMFELTKMNMSKTGSLSSRF
jgi:ABC-type protease/lipase transport system fused ATPase/permease subunit